MKLRTLALLLGFLMLFSMASCTQPDRNDDPADSTLGSTTADPADVKTPNNVNVFVLSGTTGFGMAKFMNDETAKANSLYSFQVKSDASDVTSALINGDADIAALPTNAAANVYNKTNGGVKLLAINTLGVLYLVTTDGSSPTSFEDLRGKTVYTPAQNPAFIFQYLCQANGLQIGTDITIDSTSYAAPANLKDAVAAGAVEIAVLPEPMVTIAANAAKSNQISVTTAMDLTAEWNKVSPENSLVQGCLVVRTQFLEQYPNVVSEFLTAYEASIQFLLNDPATAAEMIAANNIFANANVAKVAIPKCNICYLAGAEMRSSMENYLTILYGIAPASIGGKLPADDFYYSSVK